MTWLAPWAWAGLLALGVPVLIHMLARQRARRQPFPTLRFLGATRSVASRRARIRDLPLLAVRLLVLAFAVAALAQPYVLGARRTARLAGAVTRVVLVDTSASVRQPAAAGESGLEEARRLARGAAAEADAAVVIETAAPARQVEGAAAWLAARPGTRELMIVSDFQAGAIDSIALARVPPGVGIDMLRVRPRAMAERVTRHGAFETVARASIDTGVTRASWYRREAAEPSGPTLLLASDDERAAAESTLRAALAAAAPAPDPARPVAIVFPGYPGRATLLAAARPPDLPWMGDAAAALRRDPLLDAAGPVAGAGPVIARVAAATIAGVDRLLIASDAPAGTLASAALIAATGRATATVPAPAELDPATTPDSALAAWRRPAVPAATVAGARSPAGESDGRWVWLAVLALLGIETWMRRGQSVGQSAATGPAER